MDIRPADQLAPPPAQYEGIPWKGIGIFILILAGGLVLNPSTHSQLGRYFSAPPAGAHPAASASPGGITSPGQKTAGGAALSKQPAVSPQPGAKTAPGSAGPKAPAQPALPPKAGLFTLTGVSMYQPRTAIINGKSQMEGDTLNVSADPGWRVVEIREDSVILQRAGIRALLPVQAVLTKPLNDQLHPLN